MAAKMSPIPNGRYVVLLALLSGHALIGGYFAATRPEGAGTSLTTVSHNSVAFF